MMQRMGYANFGEGRISMACGRVATNRLTAKQKGSLHLNNAQP